MCQFRRLTCAFNEIITYVSPSQLSFIIKSTSSSVYRIPLLYRLDWFPEGPRRDPRGHTAGRVVTTWRPKTAWRSARRDGHDVAYWSSHAINAVVTLVCKSILKGEFRTSGAWCFIVKTRRQTTRPHLRQTEEFCGNTFTVQNIAK